MHTRWDREHRNLCTDCYNEWLDEADAMDDDAELDGEDVFCQ